MTTATFDLAEVPKAGLTVIEASAGTGKTYSLAALTVLGLATGRVTTREVLVVTFTEAATAELSGRLRRRLVNATALLEAFVPDSTPLEDPVDRLLVAGSDVDRRERAERLAAGLAEFDAMTISTIHGFCQRLLAAAGAGSATLSADESDVAEVVSDMIISSGEPMARPDRVISAVRRRLALPDATLSTHPQAKAEHRAIIDSTRSVIEDAVREVTIRRHRWRHRTFDTLLSDTRLLVSDSERSSGLVAELRQRFQLVLIDEFQDTDRVQWDIFRTCFLDDPARGRPAAMVVVGDPKQSIYRFRGAELSAYLSAVRYAEEHGGAMVSLDTNFRSDAGLLAALQLIFDGATFGDVNVTFHPVKAGRTDNAQLLDARSTAAPFEWRLMHPPADGKGKVAAADGHSWCRTDLVNEVVRYLNEVRIVHNDGSEGPVQPADIGIVVRSNSAAHEIARQLRDAGVPVTTGGTDSVLDSTAAMHWNTLIDALGRPGSPTAARTVAFSAFGDLDAEQLCDLSEAEELDLIERQHRLVHALQRGGVAQLMAELRRNGYQQRLLTYPGGERILTDIDHIAELLQRGTNGKPTDSSHLATLLADYRSRAEDSSSGELLDRRLDRDDATVKVMTVHKAKGLEFPIVLCPGLWSAPGGRSTLRHAHDDDEGRRTFNTFWVTGLTEYAAVNEVRTAAVEEERGEDRRALYVACTRAIHRLVVWEVPDHRHGTQPLRELLSDTCGVDLDDVAARSDGAMSVVHLVEQPSVKMLRQTTPTRRYLAAAVFEGELAANWRVWSFSGIQRAVSDGSLSHRFTEPVPAPAGGFDEPSEATEDASPASTASNRSLRDIPGSTAFGSLVHGVLENVDFASAHLRDDLEEACAEALGYRTMNVDPTTLAVGLSVALHAPIGGPFGGRRLIDVSQADRLNELEFHMPLVQMSTNELARRIRDALPDNDPMLPWFASAADGMLDIDIEGMLTGSIDLVARVDGRYFIADYKTNRISADAEFTTDELIGEMFRHGYPLQAVIYLVALRRYLRYRLGAHIDVDELVAGAAYFFVRGMDPRRAATDTRGVLWWTPPSSAIASLDRMFEVESL